MRGPADVFYDKCIHGQILEKPVLKLEENEAIVVYRETRNEGSNAANAPDTTAVEGKPDPSTWIKPTETRGANSNVVRRIVCGPVVFVPQHNEWLHEFSWHGTLIKAKGQLPAATMTEKLLTRSTFLAYDFMPTTCTTLHVTCEVATMQSSTCT